MIGHVELPSDRSSKMHIASACLAILCRAFFQMFLELFLRIKLFAADCALIGLLGFVFFCHWGSLLFCMPVIMAISSRSAGQDAWSFAAACEWILLKKL